MVLIQQEQSAAPTASPSSATPSYEGAPSRSVPGEAGTTVPSRRTVRIEDENIPEEAVLIIGIVFGSIVVIALGVPIIRFVTRVLEKRLDRSLLRATEVTQQMQQFQQSIDTMAIEIERIGEAQRFQTKLLADRAQLPSTGTRGDS
jgi:hypothetical protein